jgi:sirohydrochlorin ferrochelatase
MSNSTSRLPIAVVLVDHGSRRDQSNRQLLELADRLRHRDAYDIVEPAHMELAEPSIKTAIDKAVAQGARHIVVCPFLLFEGRHWHQDIPRLAQQAVARHAGVQLCVSDPLGIDNRLLDIVQDRVAAAVAASAGRGRP